MRMDDRKQKSEDVFRSTFLRSTTYFDPRFKVDIGHSSLCRHTMTTILMSTSFKDLKVDRK